MTAPRATSSDFPIVGLGASAGGLAAFEAFLGALPGDPTQLGFALVLVQHLSPDHHSILAELISRQTQMEVAEVTSGMLVQPNRVYVMPPKCDIELSGGALRLSAQAEPRGQRRPIDRFFRSLAIERGARAIGVILSGTGSDGTEGARAIKDHNGLIIAQEPSSADHDGMPCSVISAGLADLVLTPQQMPGHILEYIEHAAPVSGEEEPTAASDSELMAVCELLRERVGHDFTLYKSATIRRRVERRMAIHRQRDIDDYVQLLANDEGEGQALFRDLLIGVTSFFRDPDAFRLLEHEVILPLFDGRGSGDVIRIWVAGCSTGEEAYSIAILVQEQNESLERPLKVQIFATDIDDRAIERARHGVYSASIAEDVGPDRLGRFFHYDEANDTYRIQKELRERIIFCEHSMIKDPPFSRLDLLVVRNVLIYMNAELQQRLVPVFRYALNAGGVLFLGSAESLSEDTETFSPVSRTHKIYRRDADSTFAARSLQRPIIMPTSAQRRLGGHRLRRQGDGTSTDLAAVMAQAVLQHFDPVALLIDALGDVLYIHGRTGQFLEPAPGTGGMNIFDMAREGLRPDLTLAVHRAVSSGQPIRHPGVRVESNGRWVAADLTVRPIQVVSGEAPVYLVVFDGIASTEEPADDGPISRRAEGAKHDKAVMRMQRELQAKDEYLQSALEELETSNEQLRSSNEELQSVNEELQSTNEELETSKEEMQSANEELATVNAELQGKVADLSRANNDMNNLLAGTGIGTLFVDRKLCISRFTPSVTKVINLIQSDVGRPIEHTVTNLRNYDRLVADLQHVLDTLDTIDAEVQTKSGDWYLMHIRPYRTLANAIQGAVITFVNVSKRKQAEAAVREAKNLAERIVQAIREPLLVLDGEATVLMANDAYCEAFGHDLAAIVGNSLYEIADGRWNRPAWRQALERVVSSDRPEDEVELADIDSERGTRLRVSIRRIHQADEQTEALALLAMRSVVGNNSAAV